MIKFDSSDKCLMNLLSKEEAEAYTYFLNNEIKRHILAIAGAKEVILEGESYIYDPNFWKAVTPFYRSAIRRHKKDIVQSQVRIKQVKQMYGEK